MTDRDDRRARRHTGVLVVEGDELLRDLLVHDVRDMGYRVEAAASGGTALEALSNNGPFDVALLDARIADPDYRGVLAWGRAVHPGTRFVAIVPFSDGPTVAQAMALAPFACLTMPFTARELESVIELARNAQEESDNAAGTPRREPFPFEGRRRR